MGAEDGNGVGLPIILREEVVTKTASEVTAPDDTTVCVTAEMTTVVNEES